MISRILLILCTLSVNNALSASKFLLLLGPSGAGKSTIIKHLKQIDKRFVYISPLTTRNLRPGETDKIHASLEEIKQLQNENKLLKVNVIYDIYYATPKEPIDASLENNLFPVLDWPVNELEVMQKQYKDKLYVVYVQPDNLEELQRRLANDGRDKTGKRYEAGIQELQNYLDGKYDNFIDLKVINTKDCDKETAQFIYDQFIANIRN